MFIRRPKDDRLKWGIPLESKKPPPDRLVFYTATAGKPLHGLTLYQLKQNAVAEVNEEAERHKAQGTLRKFIGEPLTRKEMEQYQAIADSGVEFQPRNLKEVTVNRMTKLIGARKWVSQLLLLRYDSADGKRKIPKENYFLAMMFLQRTWEIAYILMNTFQNAEPKAKELLSVYLSFNMGLFERVTACGWPVLHTDSANNHEIVQQAGLDVGYSS